MSERILHALEDSEIPLLSNSQLRFLQDAISIVRDLTDNAAIGTSPDGNEENNEAFAIEVRVLEENLNVIINCLRTGRSAKKRFVKAYPKWKKIRQDSIQMLKEISNAINGDRFNSNVSRMVGYCTSLAGGCLTAGSAVLTAATMGLATPLLIAGTSMVVAGVSTSFGTSVAETVLLKKKQEKAQEVIRKDTERYAEMGDWLKRACDLQEALEKILGMDVVNDIIEAVKQLIDDAFRMHKRWERLSYMRTGIQGLLNLFPELIQQAGAIHLGVFGTLIVILLAVHLLIRHSGNRLVFDSAALTLRSILGIASLLDDTLDLLRLTTLLRGSTVLAKALVRGVVSVVGILLDGVGIVLTSIDIHRGSLSPAAKEIADAAEEMEKETEILDRVFQSLQSIA